ncbi:MAG: phosphate acetyltransferase [Treponema sp.]|nr:phosphate acetyltransferase [Treponema sp.]
MDFLTKTLSKAKARQKKLVLTAGEEPETLRAAKVILTERLASEVILLGKESEIHKQAAHEGIDHSDMTIINPEHSDDFDDYAGEYYDLRKIRGLTEEQAQIDILSPLRWGAMMVRMGDADAVIAGARDNAVDVFFAGLSIIGTAPNIRTASSCTIVLTEDSSWGADGAFIFSDCSIVPNPLPDQLSDIAQSAAQTCRDLFDHEPVLAFISHSTRGSKRDNKDIEKLRICIEMVKFREPSLLVDGEMQLGVALNPAVTDIKLPGSPVRGKVNTLIFPNIDTGNVAYQTARLFGKAAIFGPFLQGFAKPIGYIPRGSELNSAVITCAAALARAK